MSIRMLSRQFLIRNGIPQSVVNFQFSIFGTLCWFIYNLFQEEPLSGFGYPCLSVGFVTGCLSVFVSILLANALKHESVEILGVLGSLDILYAVILQKLFLQYKTDSIFMIGAFFIILGSILVCSTKFNRNQSEKNATMNKNIRHL